MPSVSVVVITRDRPRDLEVCLPAVLASEFRDFDLVVVDQSSTSDSADLVTRLADRDPRIRLVSDAGKGAARARNIGLRATAGEIVVFTDDDCEPEPGWLGTLVEALTEDPGAGIAYGTVTPGPHDPRAGFIVGFKPKRRLRLTGKAAKLRDGGISANVGFRRSALVSTGGFDEVLGPGSYFPCAEDFDLAYRVLASGYALLHEPEARLLHHGLRDWRSGSGLVYRTYIAIGAAYMKYVRVGDVVGVALLGRELWLAASNIAVNLVRRRGPIGLRRFAGLLVGMVRSFELRVNRHPVVYVPPTTQAEPVRPATETAPTYVR
jgi:GT2 family glycosyltransferase